MVKTGVNLHSLRQLNETIPELIERVGATPFDGVELVFARDEVDYDAVLDACDDAGVSIIGAMDRIDRYASAFDTTVEMAETIDCGMICVSYLDRAHYTSEAAARETAGLLSTVGGRFRDKGIDFAYHNHDQEFVDYGEKTAFDVLTDALESQVSIELDVGWAQAGGEDPVALLNRLGDQVSYVHMKDIDNETGIPVEVGNGDVDLDSCAQAAINQDAEWLIYEHDFPDDPKASLERGAAFLEAYKK